MPKIVIGPDMTGDDLRAWREQQPGDFVARNGEERTGWTQEHAADWYGCSTRQWQRYENGDSEIPLPLVRRIQAYRTSFDEALDRIMDTPIVHLEEWRSPFPGKQEDRERMLEEMSAPMCPEPEDPGE